MPPAQRCGCRAGVVQRIKQKAHSTEWALWLYEVPSCPSQSSGRSAGAKPNCWLVVSRLHCTKLLTPSLGFAASRPAKAVQIRSRRICRMVSPFKNTPIKHGDKTAGSSFGRCEATARRAVGRDSPLQCHQRSAVAGVGESCAVRRFNAKRPTR